MIRRRPIADDRALRELAGAAMLEAHFTPRQLAASWQLDVSTVRRLFVDEPGVLKIGKSGRPDGKRDYLSLRIPRSVAERVYKRRTS